MNFKVKLFMFTAILVFNSATGGFVDTMTDVPKKLGSIFTLVVKDLTSSAVGTLRHGIRPFSSGQDVIGRRPWRRNREKIGDTENKKDEAKKTRHATNYPRRIKYRRRQKPQQNNNN
ncbi:uncharacterized protein LOC105389652 [Plutella xylostella]|uniref:uncharacterized protein LOC105389652 n=1 Tax=Plutella xylostella TaxID=51655 RepID=UPI002032D9D1|nr:uncharacterized protein LOC105389652 [Plutella xylostella]